MTSPSILGLADLATPMSIRVAATLGLAEHAGSSGATPEDLADTTGASEPGLRRLLDHLVTVGVFDHDAASGRYTPTALGAQMREVHHLLDIDRAGGRAELAFVDLLDAVVTGEPAYPRRYGADFWSDLGTHPELRRSFDAQMHWRFGAQARQIAGRGMWGRFSSVLDVGGGDGTLLAEILRAHPGVHGTVLDLSVATARERFAADGLADRAGAVTGSFFAPLPAGFDAYLLCDVLHDWDDAHARDILSACARAAAPGGSVLVIDATRGRDAGGTAADLFVLMCFGARKRSLDELAGLAGGCGLVLVDAGAVTEERTLLELRVARDDRAWARGRPAT